MKNLRTLLTAGALALSCTALLAMVGRGPVPFVKSAKFFSDPDAAVEQAGDKRRLSVGANESGPLAAEEERYLTRAFPLTEVPFTASMEAMQAYYEIQLRGDDERHGRWRLVGPSVGSVPAALSVYGGGPEATETVSGRITALLISPSCNERRCRVLSAAAGGGIWMTDRALDPRPRWRFVSEELGTSAIGSLALDPNDSSGNTVYAGTGEANASADSGAGVGLYRSRDGGETWEMVGTSATVSYGRAIGSIAIDPTDANTIYIATARAVRGISSVSGGVTSNPPVAAPFGVYKTTDRGSTWTLIWNGNNSIRGVRRIELAPRDSTTLYASAYQHGLWRSTGGGAFEQIFFPTSFGVNTSRTEFDVTVKDDATRIYIGDGGQGNLGVGAVFSQVFRADAVNNTPAAALRGANNNAGWTSLTSPNPAMPGYGSYDYCGGQCWYDNVIFTPAGYPDVVYLGGSHQYGETYGISNGRGVVLSTDAGVTFTDMTVEGANPPTAANLHPDHHAIVVHPRNPFLFFSGSDGGIVRSNGRFRNISAQCADRSLTGSTLAACQRLLARVPERFTSMNAGLSTLQFQSVRVDPRNVRNLIGGTQDNGTWINESRNRRWTETIYGDGGQAGISGASSDFLFNTFTGQSTDVNFRGGDPTAWVVATGPIVSSPEGALFYPPNIADPHPDAGKTIFHGSQSVWRTQNWGGDQAFLEANCAEFTTSSATVTCGDFTRIGPAGGTDLTVALLGTRAGGFVAALERSAGDISTLWVGTTAGRIFLSRNANLPASSVTFTRIDTLAAADPGRFPSSIAVDPEDANHAWISYSGYSAATPTTPGHVFEVRYDPATSTATWTPLDGGTGPMGDLPTTALVRDHGTGDLYAGTDFGVLVLRQGTTTWLPAGPGLPAVSVAGLTLSQDRRVLYAATHGRSVWRMNLFRTDDEDGDGEARGNR